MNNLNSNNRNNCGVTQDQMILARSKLWTPELDKLLRKWKLQIGKRERGHLELTRKFTRRHYTLGGPAIVLSTIVSVGIFSTFRNCNECDDQKNSNCDADQWIRLASGIVGLFSMGLTAFLIFMNYADIAADHKSAADEFGSMFRSLDTMLIVPPPVRGDPQSTLQNIRNQYDDLIRRSPALPSKYDAKLGFETIEKTKLPKPPSPEQIHSVINIHTTKDLEKLISDNSISEKTNINISNGFDNLEEFIAKENNYDTDDEDHEVKLPFDLDYSQNYNAATAAFAAAEMVSRREQITQTSLQAALAFEIQRLERDDYPNVVVRSSKNNSSKQKDENLLEKKTKMEEKRNSPVISERRSSDIEIIIEE
jgi:hypothetical protein